MMNLSTLNLILSIVNAAILWSLVILRLPIVKRLWFSKDGLWLRDKDCWNASKLIIEYPWIKNPWLDRD